MLGEYPQQHHVNTLVHLQLIDVAEDCIIYLVQQTHKMYDLQGILFELFLSKQIPCAVELEQEPSIQFESYQFESPDCVKYFLLYSYCFVPSLCCYHGHI